MIFQESLEDLVLQDLKESPEFLELDHQDLEDWMVLKEKRDLLVFLENLDYLDCRVMNF